MVFKTVPDFLSLLRYRAEAYFLDKLGFVKSGPAGRLTQSSVQIRLPQVPLLGQNQGAYFEAIGYELSHMCFGKAL